MRGRLPIPVVSNGEVQCPRKGRPLTTAVSVLVCASTNNQSPEGCAELGCSKYRAAANEISLIRKFAGIDTGRSPSRVRKAASEVREDRER